MQTEHTLQLCSQEYSIYHENKIQDEELFLSQVSLIKEKLFNSIYTILLVAISLPQSLLFIKN